MIPLVWVFSNLSLDIEYELFCWYHGSPPSSSTAGEAPNSAEPEVLPDADMPAEATGAGEKNQRGKRQEATGVLAKGPASGTGMVGTLDHAVALLAGVVRAAPTRSAPMFAWPPGEWSADLSLQHLLNRASLLRTQPAKGMDGPAHRCTTDAHPLLSLPPLAILALARLRMGF
jgi:hypothetical protein